MKQFLIKEYINRLTKEDIIKFASTQGISLEKEELEVIYEYIKKHYMTFIYGNPKTYLEELKKKVKPFTYNKIIVLYNEFKEKINTFL